MQRIVAVADDLSGAAETAAKMLLPDVYTTHDLRGPEGSAASLPGGPRVVLLPSDSTEDGHRSTLRAAARAALIATPGQQPLVLDSDNRQFDDDGASWRLREILAAITSVGDPLGTALPLVFLKIDSLLRGPLAGQIRVLAGSGPVVLAPALPDLRRSTVQGVVLVDGVPLQHTDLWEAEDTPAPVTVASAFTRTGETLLTSDLVGLDAVRGDPDSLEREVRTKAGRSEVVICDAQTHSDLDAVVRATARIKGVRFAGSAALGAALWRHTGASVRAALSSADWDTGASARANPAGELNQAAFPLLIIGSASPRIREQLKVVADHGVAVFSFAPSELLKGRCDSAPVQNALVAGPAAVTVDTSTLEPALSAGITAGLVRLVVPLARNRPIMLTGGATARAVLDILGAQYLDVHSEVEHGAVLSCTDQGNPVVTRPGSFGGAHSLCLITGELTALSLASASHRSTAPPPSPTSKDTS